MRKFMFIGLCLILTGPFSGFSQQSNIVDFYPRADSICDYPQIEKGLEIVCQKKIDRRYVSFVGFRGETKVLLAAITTTRLDSVQKAISLMVDFKGISPYPGKVKTWGYVYDRNRDGKIDYMALVGGAAAFKKYDFPKDFPVHGQPLSYQQIDYFVGHCKIVFNHWADDNYDDTLDAAIVVDMDPKRDWVDRQIVIRDTKFDGNYEDVWAFREKVDAGRDSVAHTLSSIPYHPNTGKPSDEISKKTFLEQTKWLQLLNRAAKECGLKTENFMPYSTEE